jgi:tRNA pseudouridine55 synthase
LKTNNISNNFLNKTLLKKNSQKSKMNPKPWAIAINKPAGLSSYDVIREFKRNLPRPQLKKIGHLGTLDPFASGLMLVTACGGSRVQDYSHQYLYKTYVAVGKFGQKTDTADCEGQVIETSSIDTLNSINWDETFYNFKKKFFNNYMQRIPSFSATKHQGKKLYELAREGVKVEKPPVLRFLSQLNFQLIENDLITFEVTCSGGTYIRQLFEDMCEELGMVGHLVELKRTEIGMISLEKAIELGDVKEKSFEDLKQVDLTDIVPIQKVLFDEKAKARLKSGQEAPGELLEQLEKPFQCWFRELAWSVDKAGELQGLVEELQRGIYKPKVNFSF